ncbi:hypothetical protein [Rhodohalobacter barkolensis]|uniref:PorV/PorQ family protein n=1 Tax=Rhodohalobacter barkolensis TaxID=2053187 RepID=A0A2N0VKD2_9BACT|nr:hypothetical protein [Rhodohalobacter barkolensis]PKD44619.1 hypothetical protein CWD77_03925 [Rhodohalobacter barkolensis]
MDKRIGLVPAIIFILLTGISSTAYSQGGYSGEFARIGFSPIGLAMGNAMTASTEFSGLSYYNPAQSAATSTSVPVHFSSALMEFDRNLHMVSAQFQLPPSAGISISLINARTADIDGRNLSGYHTGYLNSSEYRLSGAFGIRFSDSLLAGIGIHYNYSTLHDEVPAVQGVGLDIGFLTRLTDQLQAGLSIQNLLSSRSIDSSDLYGTESRPRAEKDPLRILTGFSYSPIENWSIHVDVEHRVNYGEELSDGSGLNNIQEGANFLRLGSNYRLHERISVRGGLRWQEKNPDRKIHPSTGFSIHLPFDHYTPSIDYAFVPEPSGISTMHVFGLRMNL